MIAGSGLSWAIAGTEADPNPATAPHQNCPKIILYFSRGSGQTVGGSGLGLATPGVDLYLALKEEYGKSGVAAVANGYPAVAIKPSPRTVTRYKRSVADGVRSARRNIADLHRLCPRSYFLLSGYSQGAQVTRQALAKLSGPDLEHIAAVVFFGDPYFDPRQGKVTYFPAKQRNWRGVSIERKRHGILLKYPTAKAPPINPAYAGPVFSWCHPRDFVCQGPPFRRGRHGHYEDDVDAVLKRIARPLARLGIEPPPTVHRYTVAGTCTVGVCGLAEWAGPGTSFEPVGSAHEGEPVDIVCQAEGARVGGSNHRTSSIWDQLSNGAFIPDYYVDTPGVGVFSPHIPAC